VQEQEHKNLSSKKDVGDKTGTLESTKNGAEETPCLRACWCLLWSGQQFSHWTTLPVARPTSQAATHAGTSARVPGHSQNRVVEWPNHFAGVVGWGRLTGAAPHWAEWPKGCFHYSCRAGGIDVVWVVWGLKKFHYLQKKCTYWVHVVSCLVSHEVVSGRCAVGKCV